MNRDLIQRTRDRIANLPPEACYMGTWVSSDKIMVGRGEPECGTTACLAGHALAVKHGKVAWFDTFTNWRSKSKVIKQPGVFYITSDSVVHEALKAFGVESEKLFFKESWPKEYRDLAKTEGDAYAMVKILDAILAGTLDPNDLNPEEY